MTAGDDTRHDFSVRLRRLPFLKFKPKASGWFVFVVAVGILTVEAMLLGGWLVDDSAISLAYARNLAAHGQLVSQIGTMPVEGFSNPLWTFILAATQLLTSSPLVLKIVPAGFFIWICWRLSMAFDQMSEMKAIARVALLLIVLQPAIVIWGFSGLENPLYLAAGLELLIRMCRAASGSATVSDALFAGLAASCLALTRPEGVLYSPLFYVCFVVGLRQGILYRSVFFRSFGLPLFCIGLYTLFRYWYFGALLPNTYVAKGGPTLSHLFYVLLLEPDVVGRGLDVYHAVFGEYLQTWGALLSTGLLALAWRRKPSGVIVASSLLILVSLFAFIMLPGDWMGEVRFATLFFPGFYLAISYALTVFLPAYFYKPLVALLLVAAAYMGFGRILDFRNDPPISVEEVKERSDHFFRWGSLLNISRPSLLTADVGGALLHDQLTIVDLGMLTDRTIAECLGEGSGHPDVKRFHDYIFEERKPTFIELRAYHSWIAQLDSDPRFQRDYVPIKKYVDGWVRKRYGAAVTSGDFVRRDLVADKPKLLAQIESETEKLSYPFSEPSELMKVSP